MCLFRNGDTVRCVTCREALLPWDAERSFIMPRRRRAGRWEQWGGRPADEIYNGTQETAYVSENKEIKKKKKINTVIFNDPQTLTSKDLIHSEIYVLFLGSHTFLNSVRRDELSNSQMQLLWYLPAKQNSKANEGNRNQTLQPRTVCYDRFFSSVCNALRLISLTSEFTPCICTKKWHLHEQ